VLQKGSQMLVDSIDQIHETSLILEDKNAKTQETLIYKQLDYFKSKYKEINGTPKDFGWCNIIGLTQVMSSLIIRNKRNFDGNNNNLPLVGISNK